MLELNVVTAIPTGTFAAFIWGAILVRRLLRAPRADTLNCNQRLVVYLIAFTALIPSLMVGFVLSVFLTQVTVVPGVWSHLAMALTVVFGLAFVGTVIPVVVGWMAVGGLLRWNTLKKQTGSA